MEAKKDTILIADDAELNREMIKFIFEEQYAIIEATDGEEAIDAIKKSCDKLCIIFLDLLMPKKSGLDVLKFMKREGYINKVPVIMITGESTDESDEKAYEYGASDIIYKPFAPNVVMRRAMNIMELYEHRINLEKELEKRTKELVESKEKLEKNNEFLINALSSVVEFRSLESGEHINRVRYFTRMLLKYIMQFYPKYGITEKQAQLIVSASALHDIGKIAIPDSILLKPGKLTATEFEEMKKHTVYGCEILNRFKQDDNEFFRYCYDICRYHHERYDGNGYPDKLKGDDIPIWAQVVSIVDVYDALVSKRVYKNAYPIQEAENMILRGECGVFSPEIIDCFKLARHELRDAVGTKISYADALI
jgi:putative two-component system response regulator